MSEVASIRLEGQRLVCQGEWRVRQLTEAIATFEALVWPSVRQITFDGAAITGFDSAAACVLLRWQETLRKRGVTASLDHFSEAAQQTLQLVIQSGVTAITTLPKPNVLPWPALLARDAKRSLNEILGYLAFVGRVASQIGTLFRHPSQFHPGQLAVQINRCGYKGLPIIALLSCMVGVVLAYQLGIQLKNYGANIFIADLLGMSVLREFGPLLTAIMVAGRTGSSLTAELGMMKINQEIDALYTMGISPEGMLAVPRILGLVIALPLLTIWADIFGMLGGMVMASNMLGVTWVDFLARLQHQVPLRMLLIGLGKAPVFAMIISSVGCFQGMEVSGTADSLGKNTTRSVVLAIFFIILADAAFSILFSWLRM